MNHRTLVHLLADAEWDLHRSALATDSDWPVESREEFGLVASGRLPIVREACASGLTFPPDPKQWRRRMLF